MNGTYCILWSFLLYWICYTGMTDGCPDRCSCYYRTCKIVNCVAERLENVPTGIPNDTWPYLLYAFTTCKTDDDYDN